MTLEQIHEFLNFYINKYIGSYYTPSELDEVLDRGQMAVFSEYIPKYATSQRIQDALAPFLATYDFTTGNTVSGYIVVPSNSNYIQLLDIQVSFAISNRTVYAGVPIMNKDERANRLNSQTDPVTTTSPVAEVIAPRYFRLYPLSGYTGTLTYFRRPVKPNFVYDTISGRVIVFNESLSTNIEWGEIFINSVILKSLSTLGINLSDAEIAQYAEAKNMQNFQNVNNT
jgi:hypothetical protein